MATGIEMMLKSLIGSLGIKPEMIEGVARAINNAATDLHSIVLNQRTLMKQNEEMLARLRALTPDLEIQPAEEIPQLALVNRG